ncbi:hypothetical protein GWI33_002904 [Rhynchophorus ferrugineus]|uniref:Protein O-mannosyltransferase 1 n=1 Tax=Rhynchophorus ferrugineus TaxID=354439 RepID=A0A834IK07_RHYFE|nr:hypothetical protein GWI33_002904 [Rhynchophorus ferrugineus]
MEKLKKEKNKLNTIYNSKDEVEKISEKHKYNGFKVEAAKNVNSEESLGKIEGIIYRNIVYIKQSFRINVEINIVSIILFLSAVLTRMYKLQEPRNIVFDELHYGKYVSLYMKNIFFFDSHPPLGKQLIALAAYVSGFDGKFKFDKIGSPYSENVPLVALRIVPAIFGSFLIPTVYHLMLEMGFTEWTSVLAALLFLFDNAILTQTGPHDSIMTSAFQASLEGGLASITKGQPLLVAHGSQITLRHTHGRTCWLHSHNAVYPIKYPDKRGSSHQQQVTCYSFKDVNNWWIVKRPTKNDLVVEQPVDAIKHGDIIQLVHGITSRALNSHDVAAPMSPQCQEVTCYIDYNISMPAQNLWKVDILNKDQIGDTWQTIQSQIRLIHVDSNTALKFTGRQLPDWGYHQHEVAADRVIHQDDTVWNVEEHRYTKSEDQRERERELFFELHYKMMFASTESVQNHMYSSQPLEWPLMSRGIAYWVSSTSNAQIHLLGNIAIWYLATLGLLVYSVLLVFYLLRRQRNIFDLDEENWTKFQLIVLSYGNAELNTSDILGLRWKDTWDFIVHKN